MKPADIAPRDRLIVALDLLSGLSQGLGPSVSELVANGQPLLLPGVIVGDQHVDPVASFECRERGKRAPQALGAIAGRDADDDISHG